MRALESSLPGLNIMCGLSRRRRSRLTRGRRRSSVRRYTPLAALWLALSPATSPAQSPTSLGLSSVGAFGLHAGTTRVERGAAGHEVGVLVDFGWMGTRSLRLQGEAALTRATLSESVEVENRTYRDHFFDLTGSVALVALLRDAGHAVVPYATVGVGVHALSSSFGSIPIDRRYNANPFGSHVGAGARLRLGASGSRAVFVEVRRIIAENVDRSTVRAGGLVFFNDLRRPPRR